MDSKKRSRDQMQETDTTTSPDASAKRRRVSASEEDESKANDAPPASSSSAPSAFANTASSGFSKFSGGFQKFASSSNKEEDKETQGFGSQSSAFSSFSWGNDSSETKKKFEFNDSNGFEWASKDFTFGTGTWGKASENGAEDKQSCPGTPTKPREGEIAGVAVDPGDSADVTQFTAIVKVYRLESIESDGKTTSSGLDTTNTTDTPRKRSATDEAPSKAGRTTKYVEKGLGELRVNTFVDPETKRVRARLLCRREKVMTTLLNVPILPQDDSAQINEFTKANDVYIKFAVVEAVEGAEQQLSTYLLRPKEKDRLDEILLNIEAAQQRVVDQDEDGDQEVEAN